MDGVSSTTMPGPPRGLELIQQGLEGFGHFACHSLSVSFIFSSHIDVQVFASSTILVISWTRDCRSSSDLIEEGVLVSACSTSISLTQITFGRLKLGVVKISGIFCVRGSWSMCLKAVIPRWPLSRHQKKVNSLSFCQRCRTYSPMFWRWSIPELQEAFESLKCIPRR